MKFNKGDISTWPRERKPLIFTYNLANETKQAKGIFKRHVATDYIDSIESQYDYEYFELTEVINKDHYAAIMAEFVTQWAYL